MHIIDRYLLRQFVVVFAICFASLTGLYVVFDAFTNLDDFMRFADQDGASLLSVMGEFYLYRSILFFDRVSAMMALISAMFTITWLKRHNEYTAISAAGIPAWRIVRPILISAGLISLLAAANRELVMPRFQRQLATEAKELTGEHARKVRPTYDHATDILIGGQNAYARTRRIEKPNLVLPDSLRDLGLRIVGEDAFHQPAGGGRPAGFLVQGIHQPADLARQPTVMIGDRPVIITPRDAPDWLAEDECFLVSDVGFEQLTTDTNWKIYSSTAQMVSGLRNPSLDFGADVRVAVHARFVQPLLDVTLLFLGIPLILGNENRNIFVAIGLCSVAVGVFMVAVIASHYMGSVYLLRPALAAWLPLMMFVPVGVYLGERFWE